MSGKQFAILTATVVPLVLIATFLSVGTGGRKAEEKGKTSSLPVLAEPHLTFERAIEHAGSWVVPGLVSRFNPQGPPDEEVGSEGHHDFWFKNENDAAVEVVVTHLSCSRCVTLRIALAPEDWQAAQAVQAAAAVVLGQAGALG